VNGKVLAAGEYQGGGRNRKGPETNKLEKARLTPNGRAPA